MTPPIAEQHDKPYNMRTPTFFSASQNLFSAREPSPDRVGRRGRMADADEYGTSPATRPVRLNGGRTTSDASNADSETDGANSGHITMEEPERPRMFKRNTARAESSKSMGEVLRLARNREEQETLLNDEELADDDGCYPPRENDDPRTPNPHSQLPVYTTIHKVRRLVMACIGRLRWRIAAEARKQLMLLLSR